MKKIVLSLAVVFLIGANLAMAQTAAADFDPTFGSTMPKFSFLPGGVSFDIEINSAGEIVVGAGAGLLVYSPNGVLIQSKNPVVPNFIQCKKLKIVENDNILVVGTVNGANGYRNRALFKLDRNLNLIPTFGIDGVSILQGDTNYDVNGVTIQGDGKIVVVGVAYKIPNDSLNYYQFTTRFNPNGSVDTTFANTGTIFERVNQSLAIGKSVAMQGDNIVVGGTNLGGNFHTVVYDKFGSRQTGFNNGNILVGIGNQVGVQPDGKIVALRYDPYTLSVARMKADGTLDSTFGTPNGYVTHVFQWGYAVSINKLFIDRRLGITVAGNYNSRAFIARFNSNGSLDTRFKTTAQQTLPAGANSLDLSPYQTTLWGTNDFEYYGSRIILVTPVYNSPNSGNVLARLFGI